MQLPLIFAATLVCFIASTTYVLAQSDQVPRFLFTGPGNCTEAEHALIDNIFTVPARRSLLRSNSIMSRELSYSPICNQICRGFPPTRCRSSRYPSCLGYRRLQGERSLKTLCETEVDVYHDKLDTLRKNVSASCRSFIGDESSRKAECLDKVEYGEIVGARLWKVNVTNQMSNTILQERLNTTGYSFCKNTPFNIESMNDPCVKKAYLTINGPGSISIERTEYTVPYTLFGDTDGTFLNYKNFSATGTYTLTITPDDFSKRKKTWKFKIVDCPL